MPRNIKTREVQRDIKTRSPVPPIGRQMKNAARKAKDAAARQLETHQGSPEDYAGNAIEDNAQTAASSAVDALDNRGRTAVQRTYQRARQKIKEKPAPEAPPADAADAAAVDSAPTGTGEATPGASGSQTPAESAAPDRAKAQNRKAQQKKKKASQQRSRGKADTPAANAGGGEGNRPDKLKRNTKNAGPKQKPGRSIGRSAKAAKTVQQSARQGQQAAQTAAKSAKTAKQTAQRTKQAAEQAVKRGKDAVKATWKTIKAAYEGTKLLVDGSASCGSGGSLALAVMGAADFVERSANRRWMVLLSNIGRARRGFSGAYVAPILKAPCPAPYIETIGSEHRCTSPRAATSGIANWTMPWAASSNTAALCWSCKRMS